MKTKITTLVFLIILTASCKKNSITEKQVNLVGTKTKVTSIEGFKDGKTFINYLGTKMEGC
ncbi:hypothetical protein [Aurantibacillus circumpalustris]|uniref:hypothetical protein n=1 Tax=Aurantibacillus circumpalustris TaxID=3036359 RepID=UPI00295BDA64|nr:hypothetical protein [Aurantibacillus circumpalustris]